MFPGKGVPELRGVQSGLPGFEMVTGTFGTVKQGEIPFYIATA